MSRNFASLKLDDSDGEDTPAASRQRYASDQQQTPSRRDGGAGDRDEALRRELEKVKGVNQVIENVIQSLEKSRSNMSTVHTSVTSASTLLDTWTRILSQTEHNQRLLLNPEWKGATQDMEDMENESMLKQQAAERRVAEEEMRREAEVRAAEEEERKRIAAPAGSRGTRARGRGASTSTRGTATRGASAPSAPRGRTTTGPSRAGSGIGRGISTTRARGRGA